MKQTKHQASGSRREFLRHAAISGSTAAAAASVPAIAIAESAAPAVAEKPDEGYRLTQHILDYYKSAAS